MNDRRPHPPRRQGNHGPPRRGPIGRPPHAGSPKPDQGWDPVASWYDKLVGESGSDYHRQVIIPATMDLLALKRGERVLDLCCGQGVMLRPLLLAGAGPITAVDASPRLVAAARQRFAADTGVEFHVADASKPGPWARPIHDAALCIMAVHDVAAMDGLFVQLAASLRPGGRAVLVMMHPCFRIPRQTHWGWDEDHKIQYRRLDCYQSPITIPIATHPGRGTGEQTLFHHRPLEGYLNALGAAGLAVTKAAELATHRRSQPGPRSRGEHRAAREFPVFLALHAVKI